MRWHICIWLLILFSCQENTKDSDSYELEEALDIAMSIANTFPDSALTMAKESYDYSKAIGNEKGIGQSSLVLGKIFFQLGGYPQSTTMLGEALNSFEAQEDVSHMAETNILLSQLFQRTENYEEAFDYLRAAMELYIDSNDDEGVARTNGELGHVFEKIQQYDSALYYQQNALIFYTGRGDTSALANIHDNIGSIYEDLEDYSRAYTQFLLALEYNEAVGNTIGVIINLNNLGDVFRKQGKIEEGIDYSLRALAFAKEANLPYQVKAAYRDLSKAYMNIGSYSEAYDYLENSYELTDELFSDEIAREISRTQAVNELQQKQERIEFLEKSRQNNQILAMISAFGGFALLIFGGFIFYQQRSKNKKASKLLETETQLAKIELENAQLNEQNLKTELENKILREIQLSNELELKSKSLTKSTLHMVQKNEFLHTMKTRLKKVSKSQDKEVHRDIKRMIRSIDMNFNIDNDWREFETTFEQVHSDFYVKLKEEYPGLSPSEVRLCAMIRLNLHSKDIAAVMGISQDSLKTARYRLRKHLEISKGTNLYSFIMKI